MKPDGQIPPTLLSQAVTAIWGIVATESQDARAGDQWTVLEMWLSAGVILLLGERLTRQSAYFPLIFSIPLMYNTRQT